MAIEFNVLPLMLHGTEDDVVLVKQMEGRGLMYVCMHEVHPIQLF